MTASDQTLHTCNTLLLAEITAVEIYSQVIDKFDPHGTDLALEHFRLSHQQNVFELRRFMDVPEIESAVGTWEGFEQALLASAGLFGESPVLINLQAGEELSLCQYQKALADAGVSAAAKTLISRRLLPSLSGHLIDLQQRRSLSQ